MAKAAKTVTETTNKTNKASKAQTNTPGSRTVAIVREERGSKPKRSHYTTQATFEDAMIRWVRAAPGKAGESRAAALLRVMKRHETAKQRRLANRNKHRQERIEAARALEKAGFVQTATARVVLPQSMQIAE